MKLALLKRLLLFIIVNCLSLQALCAQTPPPINMPSAPPHLTPPPAPTAAPPTVAATTTPLPTVIAQPTPAFPLVPPQPEPAAPLAAPTAPFKPVLPSAKADDPQRIERAIPVVELWRTGARSPTVIRRKTTRQGGRENREKGRFEPILLGGAEAATLALKFDAAAAGKTLAATASPAITLNPPIALGRISAQGAVAFEVALAGEAGNGRLQIEVDNVITVLDLVRVPPAIAKNVDAARKMEGAQ